MGVGWGPSALVSPLPTAEATGLPFWTQTEAVTEAPTQAPTETPSEEPAEPSSEPKPAPSDNPYLPKLGRLCEGPIFPEPAKYLVISGESDIFYVYDNMGELVNTFHAVEDEYAWGYPGFFGEEGICEGVRVSDGEVVPYFNLFQDMIFYTSWFYDETSWGDKLDRMCNEDFEELFTPGSSGREISFGNAGGVIHIDGKYLILDRDYDWNDDDLSTQLVYNSEPMLLDSDGSFIGTLDPSPFGTIIGVFAQKYLICIPGNYAEPWKINETFYENYGCMLYTLDGTLVMEGLRPCANSYFVVDDEGGYGQLRSAEYMELPDGDWLDEDFNRITDHPKYAGANPVFQRYGNIQFEDIYYSAGRVYAGVRNVEDGSWLFRIYNPKLATDHDNEHWDEDITGAYD